jgi:hypothetical protein
MYKVSKLKKQLNACGDPDSLLYESQNCTDLITEPCDNASSIIDRSSSQVFWTPRITETCVNGKKLLITEQVIVRSLIESKTIASHSKRPSQIKKDTDVSRQKTIVDIRNAQFWSITLVPTACRGNRMADARLSPRASSACRESVLT